MLGVLQGFALILGVIAAGYIAARVGVVVGDQRRVLNDVAFFVATPALLFAVLARSEPSVIFSPVIVVTTCAAVICAALYLIASRLRFPRPAAETALGAATSGYVNSNNLGLPVAMYILGDAAYVAPLILVQLVVFSPVIVAILESSRGGSRGLWFVLGRTFSNPIIIGSLLGLGVALVGFEVPAVVMGPIDLLGAASIPMILLSFGASLHGQRTLQPGTGRAAVFTASTLKLLVMPALAWMLARSFGISEHEVFAATIIAALPTAQNMYNYAATYRRAETMVRDTVFLTTFASLPVIAVIAWLLR